MIDLSILVCSISERYDNFLLKIQQQLFGQLKALSPEDQARIEVLVLTDNKKMILGRKRNNLIDMAQGKYIVFVDDDDRISDDYVQQLLKATETDADSVVFKAQVSLDGKKSKVCTYSKDYEKDFNSNAGFFRIPNHICCVKRELASDVRFPEVLYGEDADYSKRLLPLLKTEHKIDSILYYYDFDSRTTETQGWRYGREDTSRTPIVDVIILSKAIDQRTKRMTQNAIDTCRSKSNGLPINVIVVENGHFALHYPKATTILKPEEFNYNRFANEAASLGGAEWIMIANNDLTFHDGWLQHLLAADNDVVSPHEPTDVRQKDLTENTEGEITGRHLSGWCFMIKRSLWEKIGKFDDDVSFWCSDDVVVQQVLAEGIKPMLVKKSIVVHQPSTTLRTIKAEDAEHMKWGNVMIYNKKYGKTLFTDRPEYRDYVAKHG